MDPETDRIFRTYVWSHFALHAGQRWSALKCFIAAAGFLAAGIVVLLREEASPRLILPAGGLLIVLAILFWLFDRRTQSLLQVSGAALKALDAQQPLAAGADGAPHPLRIFDADEFHQKVGVFAAGAGEGKIFVCVYGLAILLGLYLSSLPFVAKAPLFPEPPAPAAPTPAPGFQAQHPRQGPTFPYPAAMTPPRRPNFGPITPYPRPPASVQRPALATPPAATPVPAPNPAGTP